MRTTTGNLIRLIVGAFFIAGVLIGSVTLYVVLREQAINEATEHAELLISALSAAGNYTNDQVLPAIDQGTFHKESVPFFATKAVFARVRAAYPDYSYRQVALNPTNTDDRADPFEVELTNAFRSNPNAAETSGVRDEGNQSLYYVARPIRVDDPSCLTCHSTPAAAPPAMLAIYGSSNGFGWLLDDTVGVQIISVPITVQLRNAVALALGLAAGLLVIFGLTYLTLTATLERALVGPLRALAGSAEAASLGADRPADAPRGASAEVQQLASAIERLRTSLEKALRRITGGPGEDT